MTNVFRARNAYTNRLEPELVFNHKSSHSYNVIQGIAWHPQQPLIASGTTYGDVILWDTNTRAQHCSLKTCILRTLTWNPDGSELAMGDFNGTTLWQWHDKELKKELLESMTPEEMVLQTALAYSSDKDIWAPVLYPIWQTMDPLMQKTLINSVPYKNRFTSWFKHILVPSVTMSNLTCNPRMDT